MRKTELLAPAGSLYRLKIAYHYGADAVYIGGKTFSLRARASNFTLDDLKEAAIYAKEKGKKLYVTMNIIPHDEDFHGLDEYLLYLAAVGVSGIITSSMHIMDRALTIAQNLEVHLSTQLSLANSAVCNYYQNLGVKRVVLARELDLKQLYALRKNTTCELEVFIHGGMCSAYSGRCMLSNYMVNRDANRGGCAHSCRWDYEISSDQELPIFKIGAKDLCATLVIPQLLQMGIESLKIEGRMKSDYYIATVVRVYRRLIDDYYNNALADLSTYYNELAKAENRPFSSGFLENEPLSAGHIYDEKSHPTKEYVGIVIAYDEKEQIVTLEQRNYFTNKDTLEFFGPNIANTEFKLEQMWDKDGLNLDVARHPKQIICFKLPFKVEPLDMVRLITN